ncbi:MAG: Cro/C1-type helix-turn-helix domain protein [Bacteriophage sp.]|nr:MAG: Cro/C1-type helix-turn-helix domain protein [Bacteriophage sp.]
MSTVENRIEKIMRDHAINKSELAEIACTSPQNVTNWISRDAISRKKAQLISEKLGYDLKWLLYGSGENIKDSDLNPVEWESLSEDEQNNGKFVTIPVLDVELSAGFGACPTMEKEIAMYTLPFRATTLKQRNIPINMAKIVRVSGDSMEPRLFDQDIISINTADTRIRDGKIYAVRVYDLQKVKVLIRNSDGSITLRSYNSDYPDETINREQIENGDFQVLGRMWWHSSLDD